MVFFAFDVLRQVGMVRPVKLVAVYVVAQESRITLFVLTEAVGAYFLGLG